MSILLFHMKEILRLSKLVYQTEFKFSTIYIYSLVKFNRSTLKIEDSSVSNEDLQDCIK